MSTDLQNIDIKENTLVKIDPELLEILLEDKSSGKNIIWATDNYAKHGDLYKEDCQITTSLITGRNGSIIKPRTEKSKAEQQSRIRDKAEVFTPSWICNKQNNLVDMAWFEAEESPFNTEMEAEKCWNVKEEKIPFPTKQGKTWQDYVSTKRLEITCGEAPYLTSRYDTVTGIFLPVVERIGLLDRKLRVVSENCDTKDDWLKWAYTAVTSIYGFEWQGDNVLIARENILFDVAEFYQDKFGEELTTEDLIGFAKVIAWNIWQMDGLKFVIPNSCCIEEKKEETLFDTITVSKACEGCKKKNNLKHNGIYCVIKDWETHKKIRFVDMVEKKQK